MRSSFGLGMPAGIALLLLAGWACWCVALLAARRYTLLVAAVITSGLAQSPLVELTGATSFQWVDDIPFIAVLAAAVWVTINRRWFGRARLLMAFTGLALALAVVRSPGIVTGINQARQVIVPGGMILIGAVLGPHLNWRKIALVVTGLTTITAVWMLTEALLRRPLIDPSAGYIAVTGGGPNALRNGLPSAYFADGIGATAWFRPGGPFFNPPIAGIFLACGILMARRVRPTWIGRFVFVISVAAIGLSLARAGFLVVLCLTLFVWAWQRLGHVLTGFIAALAAVALLDVLAGQGGSGSHLSGLIDGLSGGLRSPLGQGFGRSGYQAALAFGTTGSSSESFIGLLLTWIGWVGIVLVALVVIRAARQLFAARGPWVSPAWFIVGMILVAAFSESATALQGVGVGWLLVGSFLVERQPANNEPARARWAADPSLPRWRLEPNA